MQLSKFTDYAFRTLIYLARHEDELSIVDDMARDLGISRDHLKKVVNKLAKTDYINSLKGRNGGLRLGLPPEKINLGEVLRLTEENMNLVECMNIPSCCSAMQGGCKLKGIINNSLNVFIEEMSKYTLADIL